MSNIVPLLSIKRDFNDEILSELGSKKALGNEIDVFDYVDLVDLSGNHTKVRDWFIRERIVTRRTWDQLIDARSVREELGGDPKTPAIFLNLYCKKNNIKVDYKKQITQNVTVMHEGYDIEDELVKIQQDIARAEPHELPSLFQQQRMFLDIQRCKQVNLTIEDLARDLRIRSKELDLRFSTGEIDDVIQAWLRQQQLNRKGDIFTQLMYGNQRMPSAAADAMLRFMIEGLFSTSEMEVDFIAAVIRKIIWQVKRKIQNLDITDHLMPIILGRQGVGKTTWMQHLFAPLAELTASTDFKQLTDDRNIDLFDNYVIILDEMGYATKADMDVAKHILTASLLVRRVMRTNSVVTVKQNAVFIGASNREIDQLIRDETGVRRFIGLRFKNQANYECMNSIDYLALWQMVDELGPDPLIDFKDVMKAKQEDIRVKSPVEEWVYSLPNGFGGDKFVNSATLYIDFREWENRLYGNRRMDYDDWSKELRRLIRNSEDFPVEVISAPKGKGYQFKLLDRR